jgi:hypothetical protein
MMASGEFSTAWFQPATEGPRPQTYFTKYLVDVIKRGIPGQLEGLTLGPIFDTVADAVTSAGKPEPRSRVSDHAARYVLARNTAPPETQGDHRAAASLPPTEFSRSKEREQGTTQVGEHTVPGGDHRPRARYAGKRRSGTFRSAFSCRAVVPRRRIRASPLQTGAARCSRTCHARGAEGG